MGLLQGPPGSGVKASVSVTGSTAQGPPGLWALSGRQNLLRSRLAAVGGGGPRVPHPRVCRWTLAASVPPAASSFSCARLATGAAPGLQGGPARVEGRRLWEALLTCSSPRGLASHSGAPGPSQAAARSPGTAGFSREELTALPPAPVGTEPADGYPWGWVAREICPDTYTEAGRPHMEPLEVGAGMGRLEGPVSSTPFPSLSCGGDEVPLGSPSHPSLSSPCRFSRAGP